MTYHDRKTNPPKPTIDDRELEKPIDTPPNDKSQIQPDQLLPALIELNIRRARAKGQADLVEELQTLQLILQARAAIHQNREKTD